MSEVAVSARPRTAVIVFEVPCFDAASRTMAVLSINTILAPPSDVIALLITDLSFIFMTKPFLDLCCFHSYTRMSEMPPDFCRQVTNWV